MKRRSDLRAICWPKPGMDANMTRSRKLEQLNYTIEDKTIAELLGVQNFTTKESAVLELVKNAYDANADNLSIIFQKQGKRQNLFLIDDGDGMTADDIRDKWMHIGKSGKGYYVDDLQRDRVCAGSKGVGRFALSRLGESVSIKTKQSLGKEAIWTSDWETNWLEITDAKRPKGTEISIKNLRDQWTDRAIRNLGDYLSLVYNDGCMRILIQGGERDIEVKPGWPLPKLGENCVANVTLDYDSKTRELLCSVESDEFLETVAPLAGPINITKLEQRINIFDEFRKNGQKEEAIEELDFNLEELGNFSAQFYFSLDGRAFAHGTNDFSYKHQKIENRINRGVVLYRNSFSISSYEGKKDWLGLSSRATASPAAASHPTGSWRVRKNQLSGYVSIDKKRNKVLRDLSNRQGLEEDVYYELFVAIIRRGISEFERYRQSIIRRIAENNRLSVEEAEKPILDDLKKNPSRFKDYDSATVKKLLAEIKQIETSERKSKKEQSENEERYKYDVRLLNMLSTIGLKASSLAHELRNKRNVIDSASDDIEEALKKYGFWDQLCAPERREKSYCDVPYLLSEHKAISKQILAFLDTMLTGIQKDHFYPSSMKIYECVQSVAQVWRGQYDWTKITVTGDEEMVCILAKDSLSAIFDNLILNSIQQNEGSSTVRICIDFSIEGDYINFNYSDDGVGLADAYKKNPYVILEAHESSRDEGHGLGMWIVSNTINMFGGEVTSIPGDVEGFAMSFRMKVEHE